jgi:hypothetical protein
MFEGTRWVINENDFLCFYLRFCQDLFLVQDQLGFALKRTWLIKNKILGKYNFDFWALF